MPTDLVGLRVFIATPSGLEMERDEFHSALRDFNEEEAHGRGFVFIPVGWERVSGGVGRPQTSINEELRTCDYLVVVFGDRWGSPTSRNAEFSSGAHEELAVALDCLADQFSPMRDIFLLFRGPNVQAMADPGPQLQQVLSFRRAIEECRDFLYETFDVTIEFRRSLSRRLRRWMEDDGPKQPRTISLPVPEVATEKAHMADLADTVGLLETASQLESAAKMTQAEAAFASAAVRNDPTVLSHYAEFLRRRGRLERAFKMNKQILELPQLISDDSVEATILKSNVLANMGLLMRKGGDLAESRHLLQEAERTAREAGRPGFRVLAYALDNLALTWKRLGELERAEQKLEEALEIRDEHNDTAGYARTAINLSRLAAAREEPDKSIDYAERAVELLKADPDHTYANALVALGEAHLRASDPAAAEELFRRALRLNENLRHPDGVAIASGQLAEALVATGRLDEARTFAVRSLAANEKSANAEGIAIATRRLGEISLRQGAVEEATALLKSALILSKEQGNGHNASRCSDLLARLEVTME